MGKSNTEAILAGISPKDEVREALIKLRGNLLADSQFPEAVLLTHAIWWLAPDVPEGPEF